jgi:hypothetical protein
MLKLRERERESVCVCVCVCKMLHPFCAVLRFHVWPAPLYHTFPHYLTNGTIVLKVTGHKNECFFLQNVCLKKTFLILILRRTHRDIWNVYWSLFWSTSYSWQILMNLEFFSMDFRKILQYPTPRWFAQLGVELLHAGNRHTDGYDKAISGFSQFYERVFNTFKTG